MEAFLVSKCLHMLKIWLAFDMNIQRTNKIAQLKHDTYFTQCVYVHVCVCNFLQTQTQHVFLDKPNMWKFYSLLPSRSPSVWRPEPVVAPNRRRKPSSLNLWASRTPSLSLSLLSVTASARLKPGPTARSVTTVMVPMSAASACATRVA